jgi:SOS-response transcriptional repressor LexA
MLVGRAHDHPHTLVFMGEHTPGSRLRELRDRLGLSLRQAAQRSETINHNTIHALEQRTGSWEHVEIGTLLALSRAYQIPLDKLVRFVFIADDAPDISDSLVKGWEELEVHPHWVAFPVFGTVDAGDIGAATPRDDEVAYIPMEHLVRKGALRENVRVFHVNGSCMVSDEVKRVEKNYAPGDFVAVDMARAPEPGDVVVAWVEAREMMVIKRWQVDRADATLHPLSKSRPALRGVDLTDATIIGPVIWRGG